MPITGLEDALQDEAVRILEQASQAMMDDLLEAAPVDTGELVESAYGPDVDEVTLSAILGFDAPQADFTDMGVEPHEIHAVNAPVLSFFWANGPNGAGQYFFNSVDHPGQEGTHWFSDIVENWEDYVQAAV